MPIQNFILDRCENLSEEAVKRAVELSMEKYCSVKATLEGKTNVSFKYSIISD
jgi:putative redox protein